jgi:hypothetical protein
MDGHSNELIIAFSYDFFKAATHVLPNDPEQSPGLLASYPLTTFPGKLP